MRTIIRKISAFFYSLLLFASLGLIPLACFTSYPDFIGGSIAAVMLIFIIWLSFKIYKKMAIVGAIEMFSAPWASPDMDNLIPTGDGGNKLYEVKEYLKVFRGGDNLLKKGKAIRIFDDWFENRFEEKFTIEEVHFEKEKQLLTIKLSEERVLKIWTPRLIMEAKTYMKVLKADGVEIRWQQTKKGEEASQEYFKKYEIVEKKMQTSTNIDWFKPHFDVSLGKPALLIYD